MPASVSTSSLFERTGDSARLCVRWLLNPDQTPQENCCLTITSGILAEIRPCQATDRIQPLALIPPLVNTHTHLEFSSLQQPFSATGTFPDWIGRVLEWRSQVTHDQSERIRLGVQESRNAAVRLVGDILTSPAATTDPHAWRGISAVLFREVIALSPERAITQLADLQQHLQMLSAAESGEDRLLAGISPHAPYTVHPDVLQQMVQLACQYQAPLAMHLAETAEELQLLQQGSGPFAAMLKRMGVWDERVFPGGRDPQDILEQLQQAPRSLVIHGNYLNDQHISWLAKNPQLTVVYCPRTHNFFQHPPHPFRSMRRAGVSVVLGTDGRSTNPDLSILRELQQVLMLHPDLSCQHILGMATTAAAAALGLPELSQPITPGRPLQAAMLHLPAGCDRLSDIFQHASAATLLEMPAHAAGL